MFFHEERGTLVDKADEYDIAVGRRIRRKTMDWEEERDTGLSVQDETKRGMLEYIDRFHAEVKERLKATNKIAALFKAISPEYLINASVEELNASVDVLVSFYDEIDGSDLAEIPRLRRHLGAAKFYLNNILSPPEAEKKWTAFDFLSFIMKWDFVDSLPNLT